MDIIERFVSVDVPRPLLCLMLSSDLGSLRPQEHCSQLASANTLLPN